MPSKYSHFRLQQTKMAMAICKTRNCSPQPSGWCLGGYGHKEKKYSCTRFVFNLWLLKHDDVLINLNQCETGSTYICLISSATVGHGCYHPLVSLTDCLCHIDEVLQARAVVLTWSLSTSVFKTEDFQLKSRILVCSDPALPTSI